MFIENKIEVSESHTDCLPMSTSAFVVKSPPANAGGIRHGLEDTLQEGMATNSSILAWRIWWTEKPGGLQSIGSQSWTRLKWLSTHSIYIVSYMPGIIWSTLHIVTHSVLTMTPQGSVSIVYILQMRKLRQGQVMPCAQRHPKSKVQSQDSEPGPGDFWPHSPPNIQ